MSLIFTLGGFSSDYQELKGLWKINNFFSLKNGKRDHYDSPSFTFADAEWCLRIYPGGCSLSKDGFIALFLIRKSELPKTLNFVFGIRKVDGKVEHLHSQTFTFEKMYLGEGAWNFLDRSELLRRKSELAPLDVLTITCNLRNGTMLQTTDESKLSMKLIELETLSKDFTELLTNEKSCDVTLKVKDKEFPAHKSVLVARSSVFSAMFEHNMSEKETGVIIIPDCDPDSFTDFLQYLYSGKIEDFSVSNALHLYITSDKYDVQEFKSFCVRYMIPNLTVENLCDVVILAEQYDETDLFSAAQNFFNKNLGEIVVTSEWENLMKKNFRLGNKLIVEMSSKVKIQD